MKKNFIFIIGVGFAFVLAAIGIISSNQANITSIFAQDTNSVLKVSDFNVPAVSYERPQKEDYPTYIDKNTNIKSVIAIGTRTVNDRINRLNVLKKQTNSSTLSTEQKQALLQQTDEQISSLQTLGSKISTNVDITIAKSDLKSIYTEYYVYSIFMPKIRMAKNLYIQENYISKLYNEIIPKMQARIDLDNKKCGNLTTRQTALNEAKNLASTTYAKLAETRIKNSSLAPSDYPALSQTKVTEINKDIQDIQVQLRKVRSLLLTAYTYRFAFCSCDLDRNRVCNDADWNRFGSAWGRTDCNVKGAKICYCDLNKDGRCDMRDWLIFGTDWGKSSTIVSTSNNCLADFNNDGKVDAIDQQTFQSDWGRTDCNADGVETCECDLNKDGKCDMKDWLLFGKEWNRTNCSSNNTQTNECSSGQTGCSTSTVAWICSLSSTGNWMKNEQPCDDGQRCYQGKCVNSQNQCLGRIDSSSDGGAQCCTPYELKTNGYSLVESRYNLYTCCLATECAYQGTCVANGYVDLSRQTSFNLPYYKCTNGQWVKQTCLDYKQRTFVADQAPQCCEGLELKPELFSEGEYKPSACCKPEECALKGCWGNGLRVPGYYDNTGNVVSYVCNNGTWTKDSNYNPPRQCLTVRRAGSSSAYLQSISETTTHSDAKCCDGYILKKTLNTDPAHQEQVYSCCAADECSDYGTCRTSGYLMQSSDGYSYKCENGNWTKQSCFSKQQAINPFVQGKCCDGLVAVTDNRMLSNGLWQSVCCVPGECASYGNCLANGIIWPEIEDETGQNPEGNYAQRTKCENGIWKAVK